MHNIFNWFKDCKTPPLITNGFVNAPMTTYLKVGVVTCNTGFNLTGNANISCLSTGHWSTVQATCPPVGMCMFCVIYTLILRISICKTVILIFIKVRVVMAIYLHILSYESLNIKICMYTLNMNHC